MTPRTRNILILGALGTIAAAYMVGRKDEKRSNQKEKKDWSVIPVEKRKRKLEWVKGKLEVHKDRIERHLDKINSRLIGLAKAEPQNS
jgi:hypothetical protein